MLRFITLVKEQKKGYYTERREALGADAFAEAHGEDFSQARR